MDDQLTYTISEVAERLNVTHRTLHFYEEKFNLRIYRDSTGTRKYTEKDIELLENIIELKRKGLKLDGIKMLLLEKGIVEEDNQDLPMVVEEEYRLPAEILQKVSREIQKDIVKELNFTNVLIATMIEDNKALKERLESVLQDNNDLREALRNIERQGEDHYRKIDERILSLNSKKAWWKKLF